jgi:copper ion binding protein
MAPIHVTLQTNVTTKVIASTQAIKRRVIGFFKDVRWLLQTRTVSSSSGSDSKSTILQHVAITLPSQLATDDAADTAAGQSPTTTARYEVTGMSCGSCVAALESGLTRVPGVRAATASLLTSSLVVQYDASVVNAESLAETVEDLGFTATLLRVESGGQDRLQAAGVGGICTLQLVVSGMSCGSCVAAIETAVAAVRSHHLIA